MALDKEKQLNKPTVYWVFPTGLFKSFYFHVFRVCNNLKVLRSIIISNTVNMMNMFISKKFSTEVFFHNNPMLKKVFSIYSKVNVTVRVIPSAATESPCKAIGIPTSVRAKLGFSTFIFRGLNSLLEATLFTKIGNSFHITSLYGMGRAV